MLSYSGMVKPGNKRGGKSRKKRIAEVSPPKDVQPCLGRPRVREHTQTRKTGDDLSVLVKNPTVSSYRSVFFKDLRRQHYVKIKLGSIHEHGKQLFEQFPKFLKDLDKYEKAGKLEYISLHIFGAEFEDGMLRTCILIIYYYFCLLQLLRVIYMFYD